MNPNHSFLTALLVLVCLGILGTLLKFVAPVLNPFILGIFLAASFSPSFSWLRKKGLSASLSTFFVLLGFAFLFAFLGFVLGFVAQGLQGDFLTLQNTFFVRLDEVILKWFGTKWDGKEALIRSLKNLNSTFILTLISNIQSILSNSVIVLLVGSLMLFQAESLRKKFIYTAKDYSKNQKKLTLILQGVTSYLRVKGLVSLLTGILVTFGLFLIGVPHAILLGMITFILNFIPVLGSILSLIPPLLLSFSGSESYIWTSTLTLIYLTLVHLSVGMIIEPKLSGKTLGLSIITVIASLVVWSYLLGLIGAFIAVPLTQAIVILLAYSENPSLINLAVWLQDEPKDMPSKPSL